MDGRLICNRRIIDIHSRTFDIDSQTIDMDRRIIDIYSRTFDIDSQTIYMDFDITCKIDACRTECIM